MQFGGSRPWRRRGNYPSGPQGQRNHWSNNYYEEGGIRGWHHDRRGYSRNWDDRKPDNSFGHDHQRNYSDRHRSRYPPHPRYHEDSGPSNERQVMNSLHSIRPREFQTNPQSSSTSQGETMPANLEILNKSFEKDTNSGVSSESPDWKTPPRLIVGSPTETFHSSEGDHQGAAIAENSSVLDSPSQIPLLQDTCLSPTNSFTQQSPVTSQSDYQSVVDLANKITSLGPLIRDPRLISRVFKMQKESSGNISTGLSTSPRKIDLPVSLDDAERDKEIAKSITEECEMMSADLNVKSDTATTINVQKEPGIIRRVARSVVRKEEQQENLAFTNLKSDTAAITNIRGENAALADLKLENAVCTSPRNENTTLATSNSENAQLQLISEKIKQMDLVKLTHSVETGVSAVLPNIAQALVKDSFLKLKQEGRAKMSAPSKSDSKQNQALLKMVIDSESISSDSGSVRQSSPSILKHPGLKNILNTMMKTSISSVLRTNMDSQASANRKNEVQCKESEPSKVSNPKLDLTKAASRTMDVCKTDFGQAADASKSNVSQALELGEHKDNQETFISVTEDKEMEKSSSSIDNVEVKRSSERSSEDAIGDISRRLRSSPEPKQIKSNLRLSNLSRSSVSPETLMTSEQSTKRASPKPREAKFDEALLEPSLPTRANTARKGTPKHNRSELDEVKTDSSITASLAKDPNNKNKKHRRRHFRGATYGLYLSTPRRRKKKASKSPDTSVQGEESSVTETTGTGSLIDSTDEGSCPSEDVQTNSEKSYPDEDSSPNSQAGGAIQIKEENENSCGNEGKETWEKEDSLIGVDKSLIGDLDGTVVKHEIIDDPTSEVLIEQDSLSIMAVDEEHSNDTLLSAPMSNGATAKKNHQNEDGLESIALSVKSRQRIKRRFTEDNTDFSGDYTYLNGTDGGPNKRPRRTSQLIQTGVKVTPDVTMGSNVPVPKMEVFYNGELPTTLCTCQEKPLGAQTNEDVNSKMYCQAIDTIDEKLIGCCNEVGCHQLFRPAPKIPFTAMCDVHLWRLRHHQCCPVCGIFCSQGPFMQCVAPSRGFIKNHLFHKECSIVLRNSDCALCPHCGSDSHHKPVFLELNTPTAAQFFATQKPFIAEPLARMTLCRLSEAKEEVYDGESKSYTIFESGKILSSAGLPLGADRSELENLMDTLSTEKLSTLNYAGNELYPYAKNGEIENVLYMLALGFDPNKKYAEFDGDTAVHAAAAAGHLVTLHLLLQSGASIDHMNDRLYTPLMMAVESRQLMVVQYLIKTGAQLNAKGDDGTTSLHLAARCGSLEICRVLLDTGKVLPNVQDDGGWTPIVWACEHQHLELVKLLLERGADPKIRDNEENIALHWSAYSGNVDISQILLDVGCDLHVVNEHGDTPLHVSARQNNYETVVLFLARGANVDARNREDEIPLKCVLDQNSNTYIALMMNAKIKKMTLNRPIIAERVIHRDISRGKEQNPLQCVNGVDDEAAPFDFLYITKNCETSPINIDRTITSLQSCQCEDDCTSSNCTCATISFKCWYDNDGRLLPEFNMPDPPMIFECNRACTCWKSCNNRVLQHGILSRLQLFRTEGKGWGVRTLKDIPRGTFICEYIGEIISDSEADQREDDSYLFDLDNRDGETYCLDARYYGNISRFVNHLCEPNLVPVKVFVEHQDLSFPRIAFFSSREIKAGEELGFDYGEKFWVIKYKWFTCACSSKNCKYSKDTIHSTLDTYYRRLKEDHPEDVESVPQLS